MRYDKLYERLASRAVKQASIDIEAFVDQLSESGASAERINELLMQDLANDGPLFGRFMRSLTGAAIATTTAAARQGEIAMTAMQYDKAVADFVSINDLADVIEDGDPEALDAVEQEARELSLTWIAELVNTCHLCLPLHGRTLTLSEWEESGFHPSTIHASQGWTSPCYCRLIAADEASELGVDAQPLDRIKTDGAPKGLRKTARGVAGKNLDKALEAVAKAQDSLDGRRIMRLLGKAGANEEG
jgi:hypothetical protein